ncbi:MAG: hypothetical protein JWN44_383 [Myxococcales bacterium]|nr:hypothetical protein [Myxococcales bacterium]
MASEDRAVQGCWRRFVGDKNTERRSGGAAAGPVIACLFSAVLGLRSTPALACGLAPPCAPAKNDMRWPPAASHSRFRVFRCRTPPQSHLRPDPAYHSIDSHRSPLDVIVGDRASEQRVIVRGDRASGPKAARDWLAAGGHRRSFFAGAQGGAQPDSHVRHQRSPSTAEKRPAMTGPAAASTRAPSEKSASPLTRRPRRCPLLCASRPRASGQPEAP